MIGIIGAMDIETEGFKTLMGDYTAETVSGIDFIKGKIHERDVVAAKCGCGKVNAALCAEAMILKYSPEVIINSGVAGGLSKNLCVGDVAVASDVVQHDYDTTPLGEPLGYLSKINTVKIPCDRKVCELLALAAKQLENTSVAEGTIATGDQFINGREQKDKIIHNFGAVAAEMESGAIGHVCFANGVRFGALRAISDNADGSSHIDFGKFMKIAADKSIKIIEYFIKNY